MVGAVGERLAERWLTDYFELVEFVVIPAARRRGVGGRIHDALLDRLPHHTARHFYDRRGWEPLLKELVFPKGAEPYLVLGLDLRGRKRTIGRDGE